MAKKIERTEPNDDMEDFNAERMESEDPIYGLTLDDDAEIHKIIDTAVANVTSETLSSAVSPQQAFRLRIRGIIADLNPGKQVVAIGNYRIVGIADGGGWFNLSNGRQIQFNVVYDLDIAPRVVDMETVERNFFDLMTKD